jgi:site-specific DNA-methyltransferase (adenine-specific)
VKPYYEADGITIYHGEALSALAQLPDGSAGMVLTDPPYSSGGMVRSDRIQKTSDKYHADKKSEEFTGDNRDQHAYLFWLALWINECRRILDDSEILGLFTDWRQLAATIDAVQAGGLIYRGVVVWDKTERARGYPGRFAAQSEFVVWGTNGPRGDQYDWAYRGVYPHPVPINDDRVHMTQKPEPLLRDLLRVCPSQGAVLDPFMGSGTTLVAARALGLPCVGIEQSERYCEIAAKRLAQGVLDFGGAA